MSKTTVAPKLIRQGAVTQVYSVGSTVVNAVPHRYVVVERDHFGARLLDVQFQQGNYDACGVNGVSVSDLLAVCLDRLKQTGCMREFEILENTMYQLGVLEK